jgi:hypothetical protein
MHLRVNTIAEGTSRHLLIRTSGATEVASLHETLLASPEGCVIRGGGLKCQLSQTSRAGVWLARQDPRENQIVISQFVTPVRS